MSPRTFPDFLTNRQLFAARICIETVADADIGTGAGATAAGNDPAPGIDPNTELASGTCAAADDDDDVADDDDEADKDSFRLARLASGTFVD